MFATYTNCPPEGYEFEIPAPKKQGKLLNKLQLFHRRYSDSRLMRFLLAKIVDPLFFGAAKLPESTDNVDIYHFLNMIPAKPLQHPYVIEFEHVSALYGFGDMSLVKRAKEALRSEWCRAIICSSDASLWTLSQLFGKNYTDISFKVHQVYPAICPHQINPRKKIKHKGIKLLFVGNLCYLKGMEELLMALTAEPEVASQIELDVISSDAKPLIDKFPNLARNIAYFLPQFSKSEILEKFYSKADAFIMPTKRDTFGFALIDALATGLPAISTKQFSIPEIIDDGRDGVLMNLTKPTLSKTIYLTKKVTGGDLVSNPDSLLVSELRRVLKKLVGGYYDLDKMGKEALKKVEPGGKFSAQVRNKQLLKIYSSALKN